MRNTCFMHPRMVGGCGEQEGGGRYRGDAAALAWFETTEDEGAHLPSTNAGSQRRLSPPARRTPPPRPWLPHRSPKMPLHHLQPDTGDLPSPCIPLPRAACGGRTRRLPAWKEGNERAAAEGRQESQTVAFFSLWL